MNGTVWLSHIEENEAWQRIRLSPECNCAYIIIRLKLDGEIRTDDTE